MKIWLTLYFDKKIKNLTSTSDHTKIFENLTSKQERYMVSSTKLNVKFFLIIWLCQMLFKHLQINLMYWITKLHATAPPRPKIMNTISIFYNYLAFSNLNTKHICFEPISRVYCIYQWIFNKKELRNPAICKKAEETPGFLHHLGLSTYQKLTTTFNYLKFLIESKLGIFAYTILNRIELKTMTIQQTI